MNCENTILKQKNIKVYIPVNFDTSIKGYWLDNEKLYCDNITIQSCNIYELQRIKHNLFNAGELAIFYVQNDIASIEDKKGTQLLRNKKEIYFKNINDDIIKEYCQKFGGCTVFKRYFNDGISFDYKIVTWY